MSPTQAIRIRQARKQQRGLTLIEVLLVVACISTVVAIAFVIMTNTRESAKGVKLRVDVAVLNSALRVYAGTGGTIEPNTGAGAIYALKRSASVLGATKIAGLRGSMVDYRLEGVDAGSDEVRAVWDAANKQFVVAETGTGYKEFVLNPDAKPVTAEDNRRSSFELAQTDKWVWQYNPTVATARTGPVNHPRGSGGLSVAGPRGPVGQVLVAPTFSLAPGYYSITDLKGGLMVTLQNPNPAGSSKIFYSVGDGPWKLYEGEKISIANAFTTPIKTYAVSQNPNQWTDSIVSKSTYVTTWFSGKVTGEFYDPTGDKGLVSNLLNNVRGPLFDWGTPSVVKGLLTPNTPNTLKFEGAEFVKVGPDEEFYMGKLTYFNGTTKSGTNATEIKIDFKLAFTTPTLSDTLKFDLELLSTSNKTNQTDDENADYVRIPVLSSTFNTTIHGVKYALKLRFGAHDANGFTTINTFHTHENKTMSGGVYGKLTTEGVPSSSGSSNSGSGSSNSGSGSSNSGSGSNKSGSGSGNSGGGTSGTSN